MDSEVSLHLLLASVGTLRDQSTHFTQTVFPESKRYHVSPLARPEWAESASLLLQHWGDSGQNDMV